MKISNGVNKKISFPIAIIIIVVSAVLVGGVVIWQYLKIQIDNRTANWQHYTNEAFGMSFYFPKYWGEVKAKLIQAPLVGEPFKGEVVSGKQAKLSFTNNPQVWITLSSPDYKEIKEGSEGTETDIIPYFTGKKEQLICDLLPPFGTTKIAECNSATIGGLPAVEGYIVWITPGDIPGHCYTFFKEIKIISPNQNFPGVNISTAPIPDTTYMGCEKRMVPELTPDEFANLRIKELKEGKLPIKAQEFLSEFNNFVKSIKFIRN